MADHFLPDDNETRGGAASSTQKMEILLRYLADPGYQQGVAADTGFQQNTVSRIVNYVADQILEKADVWVKFPSTDEEIQQAKLEWQRDMQLEGGVGAIDCTHIEILKPFGRMGDEYVNRKVFPSVNVQATVDSRERFTSVDASWPGSVHDSRIYKTSQICQVMTHNRVGAYLVGDSGYALTPWMMVPYRKPLTTPAQVKFNDVHAKDRVIVERCFGQLKRRFSMLGYKLRVKLERVSKLICVAVILHNVAKYLNDPYEDFDEIIDYRPDVDDDDDEEVTADSPRAEILRAGKVKRNAIASTL
ncbi:hypothetical protein B566_EDAN017320 [Ephemera danica]|nr:hypothetical protein B566_EDAN017320 [Ephemera danica]